MAEAEDNSSSIVPSTRWKMMTVAGLLWAVLVAVVVRVSYLQTIRQEALSKQANEQTSEAVELQASRGTIFDRTGTEMAVTVEVPSLYARPSIIQQPGALASKLADLLGRDEASLRGKLRSESSFVWLARQTRPETAEAAKQIGGRGIGTVREHQRYYPMGSLAGQMLGFVGIDDQGLEGVERSFNEQLTGGSYELEATRDARGRTIMTRSVPDLSQLQGNSVHLTIDERIQQVAERAVRDQVDKYDAKGGYAVVMDVHTGEVLAGATTPTFDPNSFQQYDSQDWRMRPFTDTFEPGSVFKSFVLAGALDDGAVDLSTHFDCEEGRMKIGGHYIHDTHAHERLSVTEIIKKSSNICAYKIAQEMGRERLYEYLREFGFGEQTGLGFPGEQAGIVWPPDNWAEVTFANIAFGQGVTATPLQVTAGMAAIANGGLLLEPRILDEIRRPDGGVVREPSTTVRRRVTSESASRRARKALATVTDEEGTGAEAAMEQFEVAGKTGTAQKVDPKTREYADLWVASFSGFVPAGAPEVAITVLIDEPKETHYGGEVAGPAFRRIAKRALAVRGMTGGSGDRGDEPGRRKALKQAESAAGSADGTADGAGSGRTVRLRPDAPTVETMPDFRGDSLKKATRRAVNVGIVPRISGWGEVVSQDPAPGETVDPGEGVQLMLAPARQPTPAR